MSDQKSERGPASSRVVFGIILALLLGWSIVEHFRDEPPTAGLGDPRVGTEAAALVGPLLAEPEEIVELPTAVAGQFTLVDFWSTTCEPCRRNRPELNRVLRTTPWLRPVSVNTDRPGPERAGRVGAYVSMQHVRGDVFLDEGRLQLDYDIQVIPMTFLLDEEGRIVRVFRGRLRAAELRRAVEEARNEADPT